MSEQLKIVEIPVIPKSLCNSTALLGWVPEGAFCAGALEGGRDSCQVKAHFKSLSFFFAFDKVTFLLIGRLWWWFDLQWHHQRHCFIRFRLWTTESTGSLYECFRISRLDSTKYRQCSSRCMVVCFQHFAGCNVVALKCKLIKYLLFES